MCRLTLLFYLCDVRTTHSPPNSLPYWLPSHQPGNGQRTQVHKQHAEPVWDSVHGRRRLRVISQGILPFPCSEKSFGSGPSSPSPPVRSIFHKIFILCGIYTSGIYGSKMFSVILGCFPVTCLSSILVSVLLTWTQLAKVGVIPTCCPHLFLVVINGGLLSVVVCSDVICC